jgi:hypothetical protein
MEEGSSNARQKSSFKKARKQEAGEPAFVNMIFRARLIVTPHSVTIADNRI